uniref:hypothetical protein n=1 Tax=Nonomuraea sp. CA-251285 TaxID=3240002 RepID=UPI003F495111
MATSRRSPKAVRAETPAVAGLNLNRNRDDRAKAFAARREERGKGPDTQLPVYFGQDADGADRLIATLGPELPLEAFAPLLRMDVDLPTLIVQIMQAVEGDNGQTALGELVIATLYANPNLPHELIEAARQVGINLLGEHGMDAFLAERPSGQDVGALAAGLMDWYGVNLGEFLGSSPSSTDGGTSAPTSPTTTPEPPSVESGGSPEALAS